MSDQVTREGDHLAGRIEENLLSALAQMEWSVYGTDTSNYTVEDPAETDQDENDWPVILVRESDDQRYELQVMVTVSPLPALVDSQQPSPDVLHRQGRPLVLQPTSCTKCGARMIIGWVERDGEHADCSHLALMRASHPEWFEDTANQLALTVEIPGGAL